MGLNIDLIILFLFLIINFAVGFGIRRRDANINDFKTYSIGNFQNPSVFFLTASFASYIIAGGIFLNLLQQAYNTGISYVLKNVIFQPIAYLIIAFIVFPLHKNTKKIGLTFNEWMDEKFHSSFLRALIGLIEFVGFFGFLLIQFKAFGTIAKALFNLPPQYEKLCVIGFAILLSLYTSKRGFVAVTLTDIMQFCVFAVAFVSLVVFVAFKSNFFAGVWDKGVIENPKMDISNCFKDYNTIIFTLSMWIQSLFPKINGPMYQRIMISHDSKKVRKSVFWAFGIVAFFTISCICMSLLMYSQNPNLKISEIIPFFVSNYCPTGLKGLLGAGLFAMSISTTEALLCSNSIVFSNDVVPFFYKMFSKKTYTPSIFVARITLFILCFVSVFVSFKVTDILSILMIFSNFYIPVVIVPAFTLILGFNVNKVSIMSGIFCGMLSTLLNYIFTGVLSSCFLGIMANLSGLVLMEFFIRIKAKNNNTPAA